MEQLLKGDVVRFKKGEFQLKTWAGRIKSYIPTIAQPDQIHTVSEAGSNDNIYLEGFGKMVFNANSFERVCCICKEKGVLFQMRSFDKCYGCALKHRDEMYEKVKAILSPEQLVLFVEYHKAERDFSAMNQID